MLENLVEYQSRGTDGMRTIVDKGSPRALAALAVLLGLAQPARAQEAEGSVS